MPTKTTPLPRLSAHFVGIGGIGISALARWFLAQNWAVTGSDLADSSIIKDLRRAGVKVKIGHKKANLPLKSPNMVIYTSAVPQSNPELVEAQRRGIKPLSYSEVVGCLTEVYKTIAVAGSHGKSTTTALTSLVLTAGKLDPNVILGTNLKELAGMNFRKGKSKWLVLEADEWNASFLKYHPDVAVVTNIDKEHLDFYKSLANVKKTFLKFLARTKPGGTLVLNGEDKNLRSLRSPVEQIAKSKSLKVIWYSTRGQKSKVKSQKLNKVLKIPGEHNVSNATAVLAVAKVLKIKESVALKAISNFRGSWRRFEYKGMFHVARNMYQKKEKKMLHATGYIVPVYDDYAHHPTEIMATLKGFKEKFPDKKLICVYQPHQAKRLQALFKEFVSAFDLADVLILLPIYEVAGRDKVNSIFTSEKLVKAIQKKYPNKKVFYLANPKKIRNMIHVICNMLHNNHAVVVMMGAGTIVNYTPLLLAKLKS